VTKGPFANVSELVSGYWIWKVKDLDEASDWVKRRPNPMPGPSTIEIRELYEMGGLRLTRWAVGAVDDRVGRAQWGGR
jgi:hypothetical protein